MSAFVNVLQELFYSDDNETSVRGDGCENAIINSTEFYQFVLIPAALIILAFCFTEQRRTFRVDVLHGFPGLAQPMDMMTITDRLSYACASGTTAYLVMQCIFGNMQAFTIDGPLVLNTVMLLVSMLAFGVVFYPIFACLNSGSVLRVVLGSLYIWMMTVVQAIRIVDCQFKGGSKLLHIMEQIPPLLCLVYLSICVPYRFVRDVSHGKGWRFLKIVERHKKYTMTQLVTSSDYKRVKILLRKPVEREPSIGCKAKAVELFQRFIYRPVPGFRYSARFLSTILVALILLYVVSVEFSVMGYVFNKHLVKATIKFLRTLDFDKGTIDLIDQFLRYMLGSFFASVMLSTLLGIYGIVRLCIEYRERMLAMNQGRFKFLCKDRSNANILLSAMKYSGFQVVSVVWGFLIHLLLFLIFCVVIAVIILLIKHQRTDWITSGILSLWPLPMWLIVIYVIQMLLARYAFIANDGRYLVLNNRTVLFVVTYFIFFYNIFLGILSSIRRLITSIVIGAIILPRLDHSVLPERFSNRDSAYQNYVGFMRLENDYTHPVMLVFIRLLAILGRKRRSANSDDYSDDHERGSSSRRVTLNKHKDNFQKSAKRRAIEFQWLILYTLINNPDLRMDRKGYIQRLKRAKQLGVHIPKSDGYLTIDDETLKEAEAEKEQNSSGKIVGKIANVAGAGLEHIRHKVNTLHRHIKDTIHTSKESLYGADEVDATEMSVIDEQHNGGYQMFGEQVTSEDGQHRTGQRHEPVVSDDGQYRTGRRQEQVASEDGQHRTGQRHEPVVSDDGQYRTGRRHEQVASEDGQHRTGRRHEQVASEDGQHRTGPRHEQVASEDGQHWTGRRQEQGVSDDGQHRTGQRQEPVVSEDGQHRTGRRQEPVVSDDGQHRTGRRQEPVVSDDGQHRTGRRQEPVVSDDGQHRTGRRQEPVVSDDGQHRTGRRHEPVVPEDGQHRTRRRQEPVVPEDGQHWAGRRQEPVVPEDGQHWAGRRQEPVVSEDGQHRAGRRQRSRGRSRDETYRENDGVYQISV